MSDKNSKNIIRRNFPNAKIVDDVAASLYLNGYLTLHSLQKGIYLFLDEIKNPEIKFTPNYYLIAKAICLINIKGDWLAHIADFNITTLISSLSIHKGKKASKLYEVPSDVNDNEAWNLSKLKFLKDNIIGQPVFIESSEQANMVEWDYFKLSDLNMLNSEIRKSDELNTYLKNQDLMTLVKSHTVK